VVIVIYLFLSLPKLPNKKQVATSNSKVATSNSKVATSIRSVVKDDEYSRNMSWTKEIDRQELNRLYELGNTATPQ
jgi:hypothetical protein